MVGEVIEVEGSGRERDGDRSGRGHGWAFTVLLYRSKEWRFKRAFARVEWMSAYLQLKQGKPLVSRRG